MDCGSVGCEWRVAGGDDASQGCWMQGLCLICMELPNYGPFRSNDVASSLPAQKGGEAGPL